jgi:Zn finger protein HypA/HybF involved in hydrogenase expression
MAAEVAYCVKCREKREMKDPKEVTFAGKGGQERNAMQGTCPVCGTKMFKIMGKKK